MSSQYDPFLGQPTASILLLGVFHFQDRGLDWHKPQHGFAVFAEDRQREILAVVAQLARYQPTKVAIERTADQQAAIDQEYAAYLRDEFTLPADEIYQLGFRLARAMGHGQVCCVNAWDRHYEPQLDLEAYARQHGQEPLLTEWSPRFKESYDYRDQQDDNYTDVVTLGRMWVDPVQRRRGIATSLIETIENWTRQKRIQRLELWVMASNSAAHTLYTRAGFADTPPVAPKPKVTNHQLCLLVKALLA